MIRDGESAILKWHLYGHGDEPPPHVAAALRARARADQVESFRQFAAPYRREDGSTGNTADLVPAIYEANKQLDLKLGSMSRRAMVRLQLAHAIQTKVLPLTQDRWINLLPGKLREARQSFCLGFRPSDGRTRHLWDMKAGLSRICPDDAREDAMRLQRRVIDPLLELKKNGCQVTYAVLTWPNYQQGNLRRGIKHIFSRFNALLKKRKNKRPLFDNVVGAMAVLEAPLARDRTWNVHLNVLLVHRGFLDWKAMHHAWGYNTHFQRIRGGRDELERAMREIIKYSARAVSEKSQCAKTSDSVGVTDGPREVYGRLANTPIASDAALSPASGSAPSATFDFGSPSCSVPPHPQNSSLVASVDGDAGAVPSTAPAELGPPAMCDWTGQELLEWLTAFRGFRRTRTYKRLYRLAKPEPDSLTGYLWVGQGKLVERAFRVAVGPLDSIPGDKSTTPDALDRYMKFLARLKPHPPPAGKREKFA